MPRLAAYFSSDIFPLNLNSNNLYSEYILTICFGYDMEQYFPIIFEDVLDRLAHFTRYTSTFWNEWSKISFLRDRGTSIIKEIKRIE